MRRVLPEISIPTNRLVIYISEWLTQNGARYIQFKIHIHFHHFFVAFVDSVQQSWGNAFSIADYDSHISFSLNSLAEYIKYRIEDMSLVEDLNYILISLYLKSKIYWSFEVFISKTFKNLTNIGLFRLQTPVNKHKVSEIFIIWHKGYFQH